MAREVSTMFLVRRRDADAVVARMGGVAYRAREGFYAPGLTEDDLNQAALFGIAQAVRDFEGPDEAFLPFAFLCARRQVITSVKTAQRVKHRSLNEAASYDSDHGQEERRVPVRDLLFREADDPAHIVIALDEARRLLRSMSRLSPIEREAVRRCLVLGERYEAVDPLHVKRVDNAVQRGRRKLAEAFDAPDEPVTVGHRRFYLDRSIHSTQRAAERAAVDLVPGRVVECVKRKLIDGRERAPQGRPDAQGRRGMPVWRVVVDPTLDERKAA